MIRTLLLAVSAVVLLAACGSSSYYEARYHPGYYPAYAYPAHGYNDRYVYQSGYYYHPRYHNLQRPTDY